MKKRAVSVLLACTMVLAMMGVQFQHTGDNRFDRRSQRDNGSDGVGKQRKPQKRQVRM